jgi:transposase
MTKDCRQIHNVIGIDVSKKTVTVHDLPTGRTFNICNEAAALTEALSVFRSHELAVCEASGGHEDVLLRVLHALSIPTVCAHGGHVNAFARSFGRAKTDRIDARVLAWYGRERGARLPRWSPEREEDERLVALVRRRMQLVTIRKAEVTRRKGPRTALLGESFDRVIAFLEAEMEDLDNQIQKLLARVEHLRARYKVLRSIPGLGPKTGSSLLALFPELGTLDRRAAASLAGVAPHPRDTGKLLRPRTTRGGRKEVKIQLFLAALTAVRGDNEFGRYYRSLLARGKRKLVAMTAVMRKIVIVVNARLAELARPSLAQRA